MLRSFSSPIQVLYSQAKSERRELGRDQGKHCFLLFISQEDRARPHTHIFASSPHRPCPEESRDVIISRRVFRCTISGCQLGVGYHFFSQLAPPKKRLGM
ncbi:hypothetical protein PoB_003179900 [Plakobranchus ocellatus]|uniref:Uncharacterized protein n=1 Tax=Plakobranchus ocellatus TaxID=259542 RepID=A0AAV4AGC0_9GAST|nr:hypothetical protein PoB_003179900 [Plakobranchus ocellatus]